jgi:hypothetical protein
MYGTESRRRCERIATCVEKSVSSSQLPAPQDGEGMGMGMSQPAHNDNNNYNRLATRTIIIIGGVTCQCRATSSMYY